MDIFFQGKSAGDLAITRKKILEYVGESQTAESVANDAVTIDLAEWGRYKLFVSDQKIYLTDSTSNWNTQRVASVIQQKMLSRATQASRR